MANILEILVSESPTTSMTALATVRALPGRGLEGDRYLHGTGTFAKHPQQPDYEVTLIENEAIESFAQTSGLPFTANLARRNLVTRGVALNDLVGVEFQVGAVRMRGIRLCEPCNHLAKTTWPQVLRGLVHRGGLRAQILSEGFIHIGDTLTRV